MKVKRALNIFLFCSFLLAIFLYGFYTSKSKIFPYSLLTKLVSEVKIQRNKETKFLNIEGDQPDNSLFLIEPNSLNYLQNIPWTDTIEISSINYEPKGVLNSFEVYLDTANSFNFDGSKVAAHYLEGSSIYKYSNTSFDVLKNTSISSQEFNAAITKNGGIKLLEKFQGQLFSLIPLINADKECAYAVLINITLNKIILKLPCVPDFNNVDFNGLGGGYVFDKAKKNLYLAIGAPESNSYKISALTQDDNSFYGKVLEIPFETLIGESDKVTIFSKGIRAVLSMQIFEDKIIAVGNGPRGGDEINLIKESANYGWPYVSFGDEYNLKKINKDKSILNTSDIELIDPIFSFLPSIAPSVIAKCPKAYQDFYSPYNCALIGSLRGATLYFAMFDKGFSKLISLESFKIGHRVRRLEIISNQEILIFTDSGKLIFFKIKEMQDFDLLPLRDSNI